MPLLLRPLVALRAGLEVVVALLFITALGSMALPDITAILQSVPLIVTALSVVLLGAQVGWRRWAAIAVGFVGVLMVVKPGATGLEPAALLALGAAVGVSFRDIVTRSIDAAVPSLVVTLSAMLATTLTGFVLWPLTGGWALPSIGNTLLLACAALGVAGGSYLIIVAMRTAEIPVVSPFRYTTIFFALALGFALWGDLPDLLATAGIALIVGAGIYTIHREAVRARG